MSYPAGAPLPSSKITLIIFDDGILGGIIPIYLENKSLSKSLVKVISLTLYKFSNAQRKYNKPIKKQEVYYAIKSFRKFKKGKCRDLLRVFE